MPVRDYSLQRLGLNIRGIQADDFLAVKGEMPWGSVPSWVMYGYAYNIIQFCGDHIHVETSSGPQQAWAGDWVTQKVQAVPGNYEVCKAADFSYLYLYLGL